jgi:hypothetical protein
MISRISGLPNSGTMRAEKTADVAKYAAEKTAEIRHHSRAEPNRSAFLFQKTACV